MGNTTTRDAKVKMNGNDVKVHLTIDWDGLSDEDMKALAERTITIAWQNETRNGEAIPDTYTTIRAVDYRIGRPRSMNPEKALEMLSDEQLKALLQKKGLL